MKNQNMSDNILIHVTQVLGDCNLDLSHIINEKLFLKCEIDFLSYQIKNVNCIHLLYKLKPFLNFPEPKVVKDVQYFVGFTSHFRKFVQDYSLIANS